MVYVYVQGMAFLLQMLDGLRVPVVDGPAHNRQCNSDSRSDSASEEEVATVVGMIGSSAGDGAGYSSADVLTLPRPPPSAIIPMVDDDDDNDDADGNFANANVVHSMEVEPEEEQENIPPRPPVEREQLLFISGSSEHCSAMEQAGVSAETLSAMRSLKSTVDGLDPQLHSGEGGREGREEGGREEEDHPDSSMICHENDSDGEDQLFTLKTPPAEALLPKSNLQEVASVHDSIKGDEELHEEEDDDDEDEDMRMALSLSLGSG